MPCKVVAIVLLILFVINNSFGTYQNDNLWLTNQNTTQIAHNYSTVYHQKYGTYSHGSYYGSTDQKIIETPTKKQKTIVTSNVQKIPGYSKTFGEPLNSDEEFIPVEGLPSSIHHQGTNSGGVKTLYNQMSYSKRTENTYEEEDKGTTTPNPFFDEITEQVNQNPAFSGKFIPFKTSINANQMHSSINAHSTNAHSTNTHSTNPHSTNAHSTNAYSTNAHSINAHSTNAHSTNAHSTNAYSTNEHPTNAYLSSKHLTNARLSNEQTYANTNRQPKIVYVTRQNKKKRQPEMYNSCPSGATGQFVYELSCHQFLNCWKGRGFVQNCAPGTLFNPETLECDYTDKVQCISGPRLLKLQREEIGIINNNIDDCCPKDFIGIIPHYKDCTKFINCHDGIEHIMDCPPGTLFDVKKNMCDHPYNSECVFSSLVDLRGVPKGQTHLDQFGTISTTSQTKGSYTAAYGEFNEKTFCVDKTGIHPHPFNCSVYITCVHGGAVTQQCSPGTFFNAISKICDFPNNVKCFSENSQQTNGNSQQVTGNSQQITGNTVSTSNLDQTGSASSHGYGGATYGFIGNSGTGSSYGYTGNAASTSNLDQTGSASGYGYSGFSHSFTGNSGTGSSYGYTGNAAGTSNLQKNGQNGIVSNVQNGTVSNYGNTETTSFSNTNTIATISQLSTFCRNKMNGLYSHPYNCTLYIKCFYGKNIVLACKDGRTFNPNLKICDINAMCPPSKQSSFDYVNFCHSKNGTYEFPEMCGKFVNCVNGYAQVKNCNQGKLYHRTFKTCEFNVRCPYNYQKHLSESKSNQYRSYGATNWTIYNLESNFCQSKTVGYHSNRFSCEHYVKCDENQVGKVYKCNDGQLYNPKYKICDPYVICHLSMNYKQEDSNLQNGVICQKGGLYPHPKSCAHFVMCKDNGLPPTIYKCASNQLFNPKLKTCVSNYVCDLSQSLYYQQPFAVPNSGKFHHSGYGQSKQSGTNYLGQSGSSYLGQTGSNQSGQFGSSHLEQSGSSYLGQTGSSQSGQFGSNHLEQSGSSYLGQTGSSHSGQFGSSHLEQSGTNQLEKSGTSHSGQYGLSHSGQSGQSGSNHFGQSGSTSSLNNFGQAGKINHLESTGHSKPTYSGQTSNFQKGQTQIKTTTSDHATASNAFQSSSSGKTQGPSKTFENLRNVEAKCPPHATGLYPHPTDCAKFLNCNQGGTFVQDCGPGTVFNPDLKVCDWPYKVKCGQQKQQQTSQNVNSQHQGWHYGGHTHTAHYEQGGQFVHTTERVEISTRTVEDHSNHKSEEGYGHYHHHNGHTNGYFTNVQHSEENVGFGFNHHHGHDHSEDSNAGHGHRHGNSEENSGKPGQFGSYHQKHDGSEQNVPHAHSGHWGTHHTHSEHSGTHPTHPGHWGSHHNHTGYHGQHSSHDAHRHSQGSTSTTQHNAGIAQNFDQTGHHIHSGHFGHNQHGESRDPKQESNFGETFNVNEIGTVEKSPEFQIETSLEYDDWDDYNNQNQYHIQQSSHGNYPHNQQLPDNNYHHNQQSFDNNYHHNQQSSDNNYHNNQQTYDEQFILKVIKFLQENYNQSVYQEQQNKQTKYEQKYEEKQNHFLETFGKYGQKTEDFEQNYFIKNRQSEWNPSTDINADYIFEYDSDINLADIDDYLTPINHVHYKNRKCEKFDFYCSPKDCLAQSLVCDGNKDCFNGNDETNCKSYLTQFSFVYNQKLAIKEIVKYENITVENCARLCLESEEFKCKSFNYRKLDGMCFLTSSNVGLCGSLIILPNYNYYELKSETIDCSNKFICNNKKCINQNQVCDGINDCDDRIDEKNCKPEDIGYKIKLAGSKQKNEGRIEVTVFGKTGYVCDDQFTKKNADVACKELGYAGGALEVKKNSHFAKDLIENDTLYLMANVMCLGNETSLSNCDFNGWGIHDCQDKEIVGVVCKTKKKGCQEDYWQCDTAKECIPFQFLCDNVPDCSDLSDEGSQHCDAPIELRLADGNAKSQGRVEIRHHGTWGTICDDDFNDDAAKVVCDYFGYHGTAKVVKDGKFGPGEGPIWLDQVYCMGNESKIEECSHLSWGDSNCEHNEDVGVICSNQIEAVEVERKLHVSEDVDINLRSAFPEHCGTKKDVIFAERNDVHFRIVQGRVANKGDHPWQASLRIKGQSMQSHWCGAVVIAQKWVLTAAHCINGYQKSSYVVVAGDYDVDVPEGTEQEAFIDDYYVHEKFRDKTKMNNDIALIKLKGKGFTLNGDVQAICLPESNFNKEQKLNCSISGFGSIQFGKSSASHKLKSGWIPIQTNEVCKMAHVYGEAITDGMLCAGKLNEGIDACDGDSGGPLACLHNGYFTLIGITSWGQRCGQANKPGVYTKTSYYREWIDKTIAKNT